MVCGFSDKHLHKIVSEHFIEKYIFMPDWWLIYIKRVVYFSQSPACKCSAVNLGTKYMKEGDGTTSVTWAVPRPTCGGRLRTIMKPDMRPGQMFAPGVYSLDYVYQTINLIDVTCTVRFQVKGLSIIIRFILSESYLLQYCKKDNFLCRRSFINISSRKLSQSHYQLRHFKLNACLCIQLLVVHQHQHDRDMTSVDCLVVFQIFSSSFSSFVLIFSPKPSLSLFINSPPQISTTSKVFVMSHLLCFPQSAVVHCQF